MTTKQIQCLLAYLGYYAGAIDGLWGPQSKAATRDFQRAEGLSVDGDPGKATQPKLLDAVANGRCKAQEDATPDTTGDNANDTAPIWWKDIKYFTRGEKGICCPCGRCGGYPAEPQEKLMRLADQVREHFDSPMFPSSTVRCQAHNDELPNSAKNSRHLSGKAMDFTVRGISSEAVLAYVKSLPGVRYAYAINGNYVHMDVN